MYYNEALSSIINFKSSNISATKDSIVTYILSPGLPEIEAQH